jgi:hypothetical protein
MTAIKMKTCAKIIGILTGIMLGAGAALAVPVTFEINMTVQADLGNFNPGNGDTVLVAGNWDDWSTTNTLTASANPDIYTLTLDLAAASYPNYRFVIDPYGDSSGSGLVWEVPASFGGNNRWVEVPAGGTNLPVVYFSDNTNIPTYQVEITFSVNMAAAAVQGIFTVGSDYVDAFGSFNNWATSGVLLTNVPGTSNYTGSFFTTTLATNTVVDYKYAIDGNGGTWEGNVGSNGAGDRSFTLTGTNEILSVDYWNNITNANASYPVNFSINMDVETALGDFDTNSDTVYVNGDWNWSGYALQLMPAANPCVYTGVVAVALSPGTVVNYKYTLDGGVTWENSNVGPGGSANRQFVLQSSGTNLPVDYFNNTTNLGPLYVSQNGAQTTLTWPSGANANNLIWLQTSTNLLSGWSDVPNTQGQNSTTVDSVSGPVFFRLGFP